MNQEKNIKLTAAEKIQDFCLQRQRAGDFPASLYRLQMNHEFTFQDALKILDYLEAIGVGAVYSSPIFQAVPGSMHGYNITNPNKINPEIGTESAFYQFSDALKQKGMDLILDVVPNHMGLHDSNHWWRDVLENGQASRFAHFFDIDWEPIKKELHGKVLLPVLGDQYGVVLEKGELQLAFCEGAFYVNYFDKTFPLAPETYHRLLAPAEKKIKEKLGAENPEFYEYESILSAFKNLPAQKTMTLEEMEKRGREKISAQKRLQDLITRSQEIADVITLQMNLCNGAARNAASFDVLHEILEEQNYRFAYWKVAAEEINYRRFFDINELAAIRMEDPDVFEKTHELIFELIRQGRVQGLRIDHPDGLYDPADYFLKLQTAYLERSLKEAGFEKTDSGEIRKTLEDLLAKSPAGFCPPLHVVVEKILDREESLPPEWAVHGTVGYEFLNTLNGLFVDSRHAAQFGRIYETFAGPLLDYDQLVYDKKKYFAAFNMPSELNTLAHRINLISEKIRRCRDYTMGNLTTALREVIAAFPVYRSYIRPQDSTVSERDKHYIQTAIDRARRRHPALSQGIFRFLRQVLMGKYEDSFTDEERRDFREFVMKFQQLTSPIMAKGLEDTVFYIYNRLLSLNEVGGDPTHFGYSPQEFHAQNASRLKHFPYGFLTTSTHDTKRSEDVRMRLNVLSENPEEWQTVLSALEQHAEVFRDHTGDGVWPDKNTEYFIFQTMLSVWPHEVQNPQEILDLTARLQAYFLKAGREAKMHTNWLNPKEEYEGSVQAFIQKLMQEPFSHPFWQAFYPFQKKISALGMWNSLSAMMLKLASPGIVDCYQGTMVWDYSLVDPDNRRAVDFEARKKLLSEIQSLCHSEKTNPKALEELVKTKEDGRIKMYLLWKCLQLRKQNPRLFLEGEYLPLEVEGEHADHVIAFMRRSGSDYVIAAAGRFFSALTPDISAIPAGSSVWGRTRLRLPDDGKDGIKKGTEMLSGKEIPIHSENGRRFISLSEMFETLSAGWITDIK